MNDVDTHRLALLEEERRLITSLSLVRTKLNDLAPVSTLPPELLENIFDLCASWLHDPCTEHRLAWTQVCRSWRDVALNTARLWQSIDLNDTYLASLCLLRSSGAPIHLRTILNRRPTSNECKPTIDTLRLHIHASRIQSIELTNLFHDDLRYLFSSSILGESLPVLENLSLKADFIASNFRFDLSVCTRLPTLRRLSLVSIALPWDTLRNLTHFRLCGLIPGYAPSVPQLLDVLHASPNIEELSLEHVTPSPSESEPQFQSKQPRPLVLHSLRNLTIISGSRASLKIDAFLTHLTLPPDLYNPCGSKHLPTNPKDCLTFKY
ncbi:hypothetical protein H0H93_003785 [Arthromyces matolae]|nr:hypothetical protein H0H93_003785 [Arthromyces matolae]